MRFAATLLFWLLATVALAVAVPTMWAQYNIVDEDGYAALAQQAAGDPGLQSAMAAELTTRAMALIAEHRISPDGSRQPVDSSLVHDAAEAFTASPSFPPLFVEVNRTAHRWLFSEPQREGGQWVVDVAPMLKDDSLRQILDAYHVTAPDSLKVPLTVSAGPAPVQQGQLHRLAVWGPWVSIGAAAASAGCALLALMTARRRGKALTGLGVSALLVGAAGWAGIEIGRRFVNDELNHTTGDIRRVADVLVAHVEGNLHQWLNLTLVGGVALVVSGVVVAVLGALVKRD